MQVSISSDANITTQYFMRLGKEGGARVGAVMSRGSQQLAANIKVRAPVDTGYYKRSIRVETASSSPTSYSFEVGSDVTYGWTLEYGAHGVDSQGRMLNKAPQPHYRPAMTEFEPAFVAAIKEVLD